jgi:hypothetical protein
LDFKSFSEVDRLTIPEYRLLMQAAKLKQVDLDYRVHQLAFANFRVQAQKKKGKKSVPVFTEFKKFYDYEKAVKEAQKTEEKEEKQSRLSGFVKKFF